ncbi:MAG: hypothetical protein R2911_21710 [Caldilineaceae bacterium]
MRETSSAILMISGLKAIIGNHIAGVQIAFGRSAQHNGGVKAGDRNLISGNSGAGLHIMRLDDPTVTHTADNHILGNFIGVNISGT